MVLMFLCTCGNFQNISPVVVLWYPKCLLPDLLLLCFPSQWRPLLSIQQSTPKPRHHVSLPCPALQLPRQSVLQQGLLSLFPTLLSTCHLFGSPANTGIRSPLSLTWTAREVLWTGLTLLYFSQVCFHIPIRKITLRSMNEPGVLATQHLGCS